MIGEFCIGEPAISDSLAAATGGRSIGVVWHVAEPIAPLWKTSTIAATWQAPSINILYTEGE